MLTSILYIEYKKGSEHSNADSLSRLPLPHQPAKVPIPGELLLLMNTINASPVLAKHIKSWTARDPVLSKVLEMVREGWTTGSVSEELSPYFHRSEELSTEGGCVLWGRRVVIPPQGRSQVLQELHESHPGISRMKSLARSFVWWPGMDDDIVQLVQGCVECQGNQKLPAKSPLQPWEWPEQPWTRLHVDYAGPFLGRMYLIVVDAYSKWLEVLPVVNATSHTTIDRLRSLFATHGLPELLVSDNGTAFTSEEFRVFLSNNGIRHARVSPYHPASNGLAERAVQTFKQGMRKCNIGTLEERLSRFLLNYRITPHSTTGQSPAELLMGRRIRSRLDLLRPDVPKEVRKNQERQKTAHDSHCKQQKFVVGDLVLARDFTQMSQKWNHGVVESVLGPLTYLIKLPDGSVIRRHADHVRRRCQNDSHVVTAPSILSDLATPGPSVQTSTPTGAVHHGPVTVRRSGRIRQPPDRYRDHYL